jgi:FMN phosphatase YigB (HAD superfamily)
MGAYENVLMLDDRESNLQKCRELNIRTQWIDHPVGLAPDSERAIAARFDAVDKALQAIVAGSRKLVKTAA